MSRGYRRFVELIERIESYGGRRQRMKLTFRLPGGGVAGVVTVDRGLVRFGACCTGYDPVDEALQQDAPQLADALQRVLDRRTLAAAGRVLMPPLAPAYQAALCGLTARTLRRIAEVYDPAAPYDGTSDSGQPLLRLFDVGFAPTELMLAAGQSGGIHRGDPSVRLYGAPPGPVEQRWLFERQPGAHGEPWPILTTRLAEKGVSAIAAWGTLVQRVTAPFISRAGPAAPPSPLAVMLLQIESQLCLLLSTSRYVTLLLYPAGHARGVLSALDDLIAQTRTAAAPVAGTGPDQSDGTARSPGAAPSASALAAALAEERPLPPSPGASTPAACPVLWEQTAPQPAILSLRRFRVQLGARHVLPDLSLDIAPSGAHLLVAPEGSAKRLLIRALCGPRPSTLQCSGSARYLGRDLLGGHGPATPGCGAALVMETVCDYLIGNLLDRDQLARPAQRLRALQLIEQARLPELAERFDEPVIQLAARERRAVEILRTAAARPALIVLDEPLAGVDAAAQPPLLELLRLQCDQRAVLILAQDALPFLALTPKIGRFTELAPPAAAR